MSLRTEPAVPPLAAPAPGHRWGSAEVLLVAGILVQVLPFLLLPLVLTVDGPAHLAGGWVLAHYADAGRPLLREVYQLDFAPVPNMLTTLLLAGLVRIVSPDSAERLIVAGFAVLLPLALRYALRGVDPKAGWLAVGALPFVGSYLLFYGFYNFCYGVALSLLVIGVALRRRTGWTWRGVVLLAVMLLLTWSAHLLPLVVGSLGVAALGICRGWTAARSGLPIRSALRRHVLPPALAGVPPIVLTLVFLANGGGTHGAPVRLPWWDLLLGLVTLFRPLVVYGWGEVAPAALVAAVLLGLAGRTLRRRTSKPRPAGGPRSLEPARSAERFALGVVLLAVVAAYFLLPARYGIEYGFLNDRMSYFPPLLLLLWVAAHPPFSLGVRRAVALVLVLASVALVGLRLPTELRFEADVAELLSVGPLMQPGSTLVALQYWSDAATTYPIERRGLDPLRHEPSRLAVRTGGVDVGHYEAVFDYFQVEFRPADDPRRALDPTLRGLERIPPKVDLPAAGVDYVLVVGLDRAPKAVRAAGATDHVLDDLRAGYRLVATSQPSGLVQLWQRRG